MGEGERRIERGKDVWIGGKETAEFLAAINFFALCTRSCPSLSALLPLSSAMARGPKKAIGSKANRNKSQSQSYSNQTSRSNASVARFNNEDDIPMDDQDLFHKQRDQILLGGNDELDDQEDDGE